MRSSPDSGIHVALLIWQLFTWIHTQNFIYIHASWYILVIYLFIFLSRTVPDHCFPAAPKTTSHQPTVIVNLDGNSSAKSLLSRPLRPPRIHPHTPGQAWVKGVGARTTCLQRKQAHKRPAGSGCSNRKSPLMCRCCRPRHSYWRIDHSKHCAIQAAIILNDRVNFQCYLFVWPRVNNGLSRLHIVVHPTCAIC